MITSALLIPYLTSIVAVVDGKRYVDVALVFEPIRQLALHRAVAEILFIPLAVLFEKLYVVGLLFVAVLRPEVFAGEVGEARQQFCDVRTLRV